MSLTEKTSDESDRSSSIRPRPAGADRQPARYRRAVPWAAAVLILQMAVSMIIGASKDAPVFDETAHVTAGILNVRDRDLRWNAEHPPLVKVLAGLATLGADLRIPRDVQAYREGDEDAMARALLYESGNDGDHLVWLARLPMIGLTLLFGLVVFGFARDLFGNGGGLLALAVYSLCPTVLAHGRVVHADVAVAGLLLTAAWFLWRAETRGFGWFAAACVTFGLALATKFTALFAIPPLALIAFWPELDAGIGTTSRRFLRGSARVILLLASALGVLWLCYLAVSPELKFETRLYDEWANRAVGVSAATVDHLPVPSAYRVGLRFAVAYDQNGHRPAFLFGNSYQGRNLLFFPLSLLVKTPLGTLALWLIGLGTIFFVRRRSSVFRILLPIPLMLLVLSMVSKTNIGIRHVAVVPIFGAVIAGAVALHARNRRRLAGIAVLVAIIAISVWRIFPAHLSYANEAFGGPSNAYTLMADSNVDWGQDLTRLADFVRENPALEPRWIVYFGTALPSAYGIDAQDALYVPRDQIHGIVAASASWISLDPQTWGWLDEGREPIARVGDSIFIYRVA